MLEQQLNETRVRKQIEISEIDGRLNEEYEAKMGKSMNVSTRVFENKANLTKHLITLVFFNVKFALM